MNNGSNVNKLPNGLPNGVAEIWDEVHKFTVEVVIENPVDHPIMFYFPGGISHEVMKARDIPDAADYLVDVLGLTQHNLWDVCPKVKHGSDVHVIRVPRTA